MVDTIFDLDAQRTDPRQRYAPPADPNRRMIPPGTGTFRMAGYTPMGLSSGDPEGMAAIRGAAANMTGMGGGGGPPRVQGAGLMGAQLQGLPNPDVPPVGLYGGGYGGAATNAKAREYMQQRGMQNAAVQQRVGMFNRAADAVRARNLTARRGQVQALIDQGQYGRGGQAELGRIDEQLGGLADMSQRRDEMMQEREAAGLQAASRIEQERLRQQGKAAQGDEKNYARLGKGMFGEIGKIGGLLQGSMGLFKAFDPKYGGIRVGPVPTGGVVSAMGRYMPQLAEQFGGGADVTNYWQRFAGNENVQRHEIFGATLTAGENKAWQQYTVNPSMDPEIIQRNLQARAAIDARNALALAGALESEGYNPETIFNRLGATKEQLVGFVRQYYPRDMIQDINIDQFLESMGAGPAAPTSGVMASGPSGDAMEQAADMGDQLNAPQYTARQSEVAAVNPQASEQAQKHRWLVD